MISRMSSMVKVIGQGRQVEKRDFRSFRQVDMCRFTFSFHMTSCEVKLWCYLTHGITVTSWRCGGTSWCSFEMSVLGLWGKNTDQEGAAGGRVNAQAFSFKTYIRHYWNFPGIKRVKGCFYSFFFRGQLLFILYRYSTQLGGWIQKRIFLSLTSCCQQQFPEGN